MSNPSAFHLLFVDDDKDILFAGALLLRQAGYTVSTLANPELIPSFLEQEQIDLVLLDMNFRAAHTGNEGLFWLREIKKLKPDLPVIMVTAYGDIELAVSTIKAGASDFISKPWENEKLLNNVKASLKKAHIHSKKEKQKSVKTEDVFQALIGQSEQILAIKRTVEKVAPTDASVLILGENGTGKEVVAKIIHQLSKRKKESFIPVDMGALPESLVESELFGHKKGAFTDAKEDRIGRFEAAHNGTLFLDEIGNISLTTQAKLLHALQERKISKLGSNDEIDLNLRIISATNSKLNERVADGDFRQDLLYRINTLRIEIPPLRKRIEDIVLLANHFIDVYSARYVKKVSHLNSDALDKLQSYSWPGNIRELQHVIERALILTESEEILADDLLLETESQISKNKGVHSQKTLESIEKETISTALQKHNYTISRVAEELGLSRAALYRRLEKYGL